MLVSPDTYHFDETSLLTEHSKIALPDVIFKSAQIINPIKMTEYTIHGWRYTVLRKYLVHFQGHYEN